MKTLKLVILTLSISILFSCQTEQKKTPNFLKSQYESRHSAPFSDATEFDGLLFLTGQIGKDHKAGKMVEGGIQAETKQVLINIKDVLEANGSDMNHVLKCTVILSDINDFAAMNEVYRTFFKDNKPARTTFAADLVAGAKIEIEVVAVKK
ncbi:Rid family detoxifying hydrolase [Pseudotenacibaculum sp. MALMAid0570]|uniref:RidA family protein n=1 Tax=Pseudotenacibaculum sp. MALMAid0570 TaxID=3143938 RepID=UPI0032DE44BC